MDKSTSIKSVYFSGNVLLKYKMPRKEELFFALLKAKILCRELDSMIGLVGFHIHL